MTAIPRSALLLGLAGLIPFLAAAAAALAGGPDWSGWEDLIALRYGVVILAFMSGVLWGFATRASGRRAALYYALSVLPALWAFFTTLGATGDGLRALIAGFAGLLILDWLYAWQGLAPAWWMRLRVLLTTVVVACLAVVLSL